MSNPLTPDHQDEAARIAQVKAWLTAEYGPIAAFDLVSSPHEHRTHYPVALVETADGQQLVAKWDDKPKRSRKEVAVATLLKAHGIPTAPILKVNPSIPAFAMARLEGQTLGVADLTAATVKEIGSLLRRIHDIPADEVIAAGIPAWEGDTFIDEMQAKFDERARGASELLPNEYSYEMLEEALTMLLAQNTWTGKRALNRRDMHAENWFRLATGELAAIDHGNASVGDIAYDLAHAIDNLKLDGELQESFRNGYGSEVFDAVTQPATVAISDLLHGIGILGWIKHRGVPQPRFQAEALDLIVRAVPYIRIGIRTPANCVNTSKGVA